MKESIDRERSFSFSLKIIALYKKLIEEREFIISKQLLCSGTSVGANIEEAQAAQVKKILLLKCLIRQRKQEKQNIGYVY